MNRQIKETILEKIKAYSKIIIFHHIRPDGDCIGAAKGLKEIIQQTWKDKEVYILSPESSKKLAFMGPDDGPIADKMYCDALGIIVDTGLAKRISDPKYTLCKELIKIDHHIPIDSYADIEWVEEWRSSLCEMIVDLYKTFPDELKISKEAATYLYTGMVTDSGRFKYSDVTAETLRNAAVLLDQGVDTSTLFAQLYLEPFESLKFKSKVCDNIRITENGVAYLYIDRSFQQEHGLSFEEASAVITLLETIQGCLCWIAFIENPTGDPATRVRLRSRFLPINSLAEQYSGGGHSFASTATVMSREEANKLVAAADALVKEYKSSHEGWL